MTKNIALCGIEEELVSTLEHCGEFRLLRFGDEPERRGDVKLAYFLRDGPPVALAIVGYPGAKGLICGHRTARYPSFGCAAAGNLNRRQSGLVSLFAVLIPRTRGWLSAFAQPATAREVTRDEFLPSPSR